MSQTDTPTLEVVEAERPTHESGSEDEAIRALNQRDAEAEQSPETPEDEPEDEANEEPGDGEPEEADAEGSLVEVEYEGKSYKLPPEIEKAVLRQSDYSRKMNEVSTKEKAYTQRLEAIEGIESGAEKRAEALATVRGIDAQIESYRGIDWAKAKAENPAGAAMAAVELLSLQDQRKEAVAAAAQVARELTEGRKRLNGEKAADMAKVLDKDLPGWRGDVGVKITQHATANGWTMDEIAAITDHRVVLALHAAAKYDALQKSKADLKGKAPSVPVSKPGARRQQSPTADAMARFRNSRSDEDAIAALESRKR